MPLNLRPTSKDLAGIVTVHGPDNAAPTMIPVSRDGRLDPAPIPAPLRDQIELLLACAKTAGAWRDDDGTAFTWTWTAASPTPRARAPTPETPREPRAPPQPRPRDRPRKRHSTRYWLRQLRLVTARITAMAEKHCR